MYINSSGEFWRPLMTYANNLDPDEAPQNVGLHLRSKLFDIQIIYQQKKWVETMIFLKILKETNIWKNYPACKELNTYLKWWRSRKHVISTISHGTAWYSCWGARRFIRECVRVWGRGLRRRGLERFGAGTYHARTQAAVLNAVELFILIKAHFL